MKKVDSQYIVAGTRRLGFTKGILDHLQEAFADIFNDFMVGLLASGGAGVTIVRGIVNSGSGSTYTLSAGSVFYNGEFFAVDAFAGTASGANVPVLSLETTFRAGDPVKYSDNNDFNTNQIRKLKWTFGASGSGIADFSALNVSFASALILSLGGKLSTAAGAVGTANLAADSVDNVKAGPTVFRGEMYTPATTDCDNHEYGTIQLVTGAAAHAPTVTGGDHWIITTCKGDTNGSFYQSAIQVLGAGKGDIYSRYKPAIGAWTAWSSDNT